MFDEQEAGAGGEGAEGAGDDGVVVVAETVGDPAGVHRGGHQSPGVGEGYVAPQGGEAGASVVFAQGGPDDDAGAVHHTLAEDEGEDEGNADGGLPVAQPEEKVAEALHGEADGEDGFFGDAVAHIAHSEAGNEVDGRHCAHQVGGHLDAHSLVVDEDGEQADEDAQGGHLAEAGAGQEQPVSLGAEGFAHGVVAARAAGSG